MRLPSLQLSTIILLFISFTVQGQNFKFGKVSKEELEEKVHPIDSTADAAILYRNLKTSFDYQEDEGFFINTEVHERIKIYNKDGYNWGTKNIRLYQGRGSRDEEISGLKGYTYFLEGDKIEDQKLKSDGIFEEETSKYLETTKLTMPNIQDGCVIEYKYTIKSPYYNNIDEYRFQEKIPVNYVEVKFITPEYFNYNPYQRGWISYNIIEGSKDRTMNYRYTDRSTDGGFGQSVIPKTKSTSAKFKEKTYQVLLKDVPAFKEEQYSGNIDNYISALKFELSYVKFPNSTLETYSSSWEAVTKSIYKSEAFGGQIAKTNYFDDDIDALLAGVSSPNEKMIRIFEFVKNKMNWNSYIGYYPEDGLRNAYKKEVGNAADINLMLIAMLKYAGLKANPVLLSTKNNGIPLFPTRNGFDFVIAAVENSNRLYLLDATNKFGEPNILEQALLNWQGRLIRENLSSTWISLYPAQEALQSSMIDATINDDFEISGTCKNRFTGHYALNRRKRFFNMKESEVQKMLNKSFDDTDVTNVSFENLKTLYQPVNMEYEFENFDAVEEISGKLYFSPLLFLAFQENPFKADERKYPIDFQYPKKDRYMIKYTIPEGYKIESTPEASSIALPDNLGAFRCTYNSNGNVLQVMVDLVIKKPYVSADYYPNLKKFFELVVTKENEKVVLSKI